MKFITHGYTNVAGRANNEDYYLCEKNIWILADGLGGHDSGEIASKCASETIKKQYRLNKNNPLDDTLLSELIQQANEAVVQKQDDNIALKSMRTTVVFAATDGNKIRYANVGDSRFYYFRSGSILVQSEDHSVAAMSVKLGDITPDEIRSDPDRNKLIKALGNSEKLNVKIPSTEIVPMEGDAFMLCSDGFWEYVHETEMEIDLAKSDSPKEWIDYMVKRILLKTGNVDNDNFTAVCVMIQ